MGARLKTIPCFAAAVLLAGCSADKPLELPAAPVDRAASCAVVAAAQARTKTADFKAPLPLEAQGRILHYAMLAASEGEAFDAQVASAVSKRMGELEAGITKGKWQALIPACDAAYPVAAKTDVELPAGRTDALLFAPAPAPARRRSRRKSAPLWPRRPASARRCRCSTPA